MVVDDESSLKCPRCAELLQSLHLGTTMVRECAACGGLWVNPGTLQKLCDAREEHAGVVSALAVRMPKNTAPTDTVRYIPCPQCTKLMNRVNFAHSSGVILDVCKTDGVWLDRGELQRVMGFVEQGGMAVERERQRQQLVDERWRVEQAKATSAAMLRDTGGITISMARQSVQSGTAVEHLLLDALGLFIK
jgi:Zn-finger nucleic acid-binding protein